MMTNRFCIVGCQRSGTKYMAELFRRMGIECGHEEEFHPAFHTDSIRAWAAGQLGKAGESSWLATPHVNLLRGLGVRVMHVVRNPYDVVRSIMGNAVWAGVEHHAVYEDYMEASLWGGMAQPESQLQCAIDNVVRWNRLLDGMDVARVRVEDIGAEEARGIAYTVGGKRVSMGMARTAVRVLGRQTNHRADPWQGEIDSAELDELALEYGYAREGGMR